MPLPTFIIGGERRGGTTSLYHWMSGHPAIYLYPESDMDYFMEAEVLGRRSWRLGEPEPDAALWERTHDPETYAAMFSGGEGFAAIGQKDADLLYWQPAHARLARYLPETRFIFSLRNPIERAWSQYWNEVGKGREPLDFEEAVEAEETRCRQSAYARNHLAYIRRGFYEESLTSFFQHIPRERVLVLTIEAARAQPRQTMQRIYRFLGVDDTLGLERAGKTFNKNNTMVLKPWAKGGFVAPIRKIYERGCEALVRRVYRDSELRQSKRARMQRLFREPAGRYRLPPRLRARLERVYRPHVADLETLLGRTFSEWS